MFDERTAAQWKTQPDDSDLPMIRKELKEACNRAIDRLSSERQRAVFRYYVFSRVFDETLPSWFDPDLFSHTHPLLKDIARHMRLEIGTVWRLLSEAKRLFIRNLADELGIWNRLSKVCQESFGRWISSFARNDLHYQVEAPCIKHFAALLVGGA